MTIKPTILHSSLHPFNSSHGMVDYNCMLQQTNTCYCIELELKQWQSQTVETFKPKAQKPLNLKQAETIYHSLFILSTPNAFVPLLLRCWYWQEHKRVSNAIYTNIWIHAPRIQIMTNDNAWIDQCVVCESAHYTGLKQGKHLLKVSLQPKSLKISQKLTFSLLLAKVIFPGWSHTHCKVMPLSEHIVVL